MIFIQFIQRPPAGSLGRKIIEENLNEVEVSIGRRVDLEGAELASWEERQKKTEDLWREEKMSDEEDEENEDEGEDMVHDMYEEGSMYPHKEVALKWDHYGVQVDLNSLFESAPRKQAPTQLHQHASVHLDPPYKVQVSTEVVDVRCEITQEDFQGTSDVFSILQIIKQLCPRHLVLLFSKIILFF